MLACAILLVDDDHDTCAILSLKSTGFLSKPVDFGHLIPLIEKVAGTP
jgi:hypothetical protein